MPTTGNGTADIIIYVGLAIIASLTTLVTYFIKTYIDNNNANNTNMITKFGVHEEAMVNHKSQLDVISKSLHTDLEAQRKATSEIFVQTTKELAEIRKEANKLDLTITKSSLSMDGITNKLKDTDSKVDQLNQKVVATADHLEKVYKILRKHNDDINHTKTEVEKIGNLIILKGNK